MKIFAVDSGVEKTGYAAFDKKGETTSEIEYITSGLIRSSIEKRTEERLLQIYNELYQLVDEIKADIVVIEQLFYFKNQKTIIPVSQAQGIIMLIAAQKNIKVEFLTPLQIKQTITGYGQSDKKSVQKMLKMTLKLDKELKQDDQADAIACGLAYCYLNQKLVK